MNFRRVIICVFSFWLLAMVGCSGQLYRVAPRPVSPATELNSTASGNNLEVSALALVDDDRAFEQFGANLPLAGLLAVDVKLINRATTPLEAGALRFEVCDASGQKFKQLAPKKALKRLMKYYDVGFYVIEARRRTLADLETLALALDTPLAPQEERRGMLFFETKRDAATASGLTLTIENRASKTPVTLKLN
jgi:hypothetical protein